MAKNTKKTRKTGSFIYGLSLTIYIVALGFAAFWGLGKLWTFAEEYEGARSEPVIEAYISTLRDKLWDQRMEETVAAMPHEFQSNEECAQVIQELLSDEISYSRAAGGTDGKSEVYNLLCGKNLFGKVTLVQDESKADQLEFGEDYGLFPWRVAKEEFYFDGLYTSTSITVPESYSVQLNGHTLGEEYITERDIHYDVLEDYYREYPDLPKKVSYRAENIIGHLEFTVFDENGEEFVIDSEKDDSQYIRPLDEDTQARLNNFAREFSDRFLAFGAAVTSESELYEAMKGYIVPNGDLDQRLKASIEGAGGFRHNTGYTFEDAIVNNIVSLGGGYYIINVNAIATAIQPQGVVDINREMDVTVIDRNGDIRAVSVVG